MSIETRKLQAMPYAQAKIIVNHGETQLWSYQTCVAYITPDGWLYIRGLYSATTRRHIGAFMREYGLDDQTAKQLFQDDMAMNIHTGEVRDTH